MARGRGEQGKSERKEMKETKGKERKTKRNNLDIRVLGKGR